MKILLVFPSSLDEKGGVKKYKKVLFLPLSLAILDRLTPKHHQVTIVNDIAEPIDFSGDFDLVGITAMTFQAGRAYEIADRFRARGVRVVLGGYHPTLMPEDARPHADAVVRGEAEPVWAELLADAEAGRLKPLYRADAPPGLEQLLLPKWDNFNLDVYARPFRAKIPEIPLYATRGCPFDCHFCSVTHFFGSRFRTRPIAHVLAEIDASGSDQFFLIDDNVIGKPAYTRELFKALATRNIRWYTQLSTNVVNTPELIELAAKAGCHSAFVGIESINADSLKSANKQFNNIARYEEVFGRLQAAGISPYVGIIFGFDHDTPDIFGRTVDFLWKNKIYMAAMQILTPFPGTRFATEMERDGVILHRNWSLYDGSHVVFRHRTMTADQLRSGYWEAYRRFNALPSLVRRMRHAARIVSNPTVNLAVNAFWLLHNRRLVRSGQHIMAGGARRIQ